MIYRKTDNPAVCKVIEYSHEIEKERVLVCVQRKQFEDCAPKERANEDEDHQKTIAFVRMSGYFVEKEEEANGDE